MSLSNKRATYLSLPTKILHSNHSWFHLFETNFVKPFDCGQSNLKWLAMMAHRRRILKKKKKKRNHHVKGKGKLLLVPPIPSREKVCVVDFCCFESQKKWKKKGKGPLEQHYPHLGLKKVNLSWEKFGYISSLSTLSFSWSQMEKKKVRSKSKQQHQSRTGIANNPKLKLLPSYLLRGYQLFSENTGIHFSTSSPNSTFYLFLFAFFSSSFAHRNSMKKLVNVIKTLVVFFHDYLPPTPPFSKGLHWLCFWAFGESNSFWIPHITENWSALNLISRNFESPLRSKKSLGKMHMFQSIFGIQWKTPSNDLCWRLQ